MRLLADRPSITYLRREAKDLLQALRESGATSTLVDAQRQTAEEYGFRTWNDLKAEVERRRAAVPDAPVGLAEGLADAFGLGRVTAPMSPIRYEYMGRRWQLETERGRFVARPVFDWIDDAQAEVAVDLQERARAAGVRSPTPVRTPDGGLVRRVLDDSWRIDEWAELGPTPVEPVTVGIARSAGGVLAAVHEVARQTDRPIAGAWVGTADRPGDAHWAALAERAHGMPWAADLARLRPTIDELSAIAVEPEQEAVVISVRDFGPSCVRLGQGEDLVVLHWDFAGPMLPEWELAATLLNWTNYGANLGVASAFLAGYRDRRRMVPQLTLGSFTPAITGWLTWLLARAWEAADPEPSEQRDFAERTLREVLDAPLSVATLAAILEAAGSPQFS